MKMSTKFILAMFLLSIILFDFFTKGIGGIIKSQVGLNDFLILPLLFVILSTTNGRIKVKDVFVKTVGLALVVYFLFKIFIGPFGYEFIFFRDAQFVYRSSVLTIIVFLFWRNEQAARYLFDVWRWLTLFVCVVAWMQAVGTLIGIKLIPYSSGRVIQGAEQLTSVYSEPALMCQYLVASLFILFRSPEAIQHHKLFCANCIIIVVASQSLGGVAGVFFWCLYLLFRHSKSFKGIMINTVILSTFMMFLLGLVTYIPGNRVCGFFSGPELKGQGSAGRRVFTELKALQKFVAISWDEKILGLSSNESKNFRAQQNLVEPNDDIAGNGIVEFTLRYGVMGLLLLGLFFYGLSERKKSKFILLWLFFGLVTQIDGAIAKPFAFTYTMVFVISIKYSPDKVYKSRDSCVSFRNRFCVADTTIVDVESGRTAFQLQEQG